MRWKYLQIKQLIMNRKSSEITWHCKFVWLGHTKPSFASPGLILFWHDYMISFKCILVICLHLTEWHYFYQLFVLLWNKFSSLLLKHFSLSWIIVQVQCLYPLDDCSFFDLNYFYVFKMMWTWVWQLKQIYRSLKLQ